jgi:hypothetical protein
MRESRSSPQHSSITPPRPWLWIAGVIAGVALALALGVSLWSLVVMATALACPIAMYFGMCGMGNQQESAYASTSRLRRSPEARDTLTEPDREKTRPSYEE